MEEGVGSQAVLMNVESFGLYAAQALAINEEVESGQTLNITGDNMGIFVCIYSGIFLLNYSCAHTVTLTTHAYTLHEHTNLCGACVKTSYDSSPALRAQSIAVDEDTSYSFPSQQEIMQLTLPNDSLANISLPPDLLAERAAGEIYSYDMSTPWLYFTHIIMCK